MVEFMKLKVFSSVVLPLPEHAIVWREIFIFSLFLSMLFGKEINDSENIFAWSFPEPSGMAVVRRSRPGGKET